MLKKIFKPTVLSIVLFLALNPLHAEEPAEATSVSSSQNALEMNNPENNVSKKTIKECVEGDTLYVSEAANIWIRTCPQPTCGIEGAVHVGDRVKFVKFSENGKYTLIQLDDGRKKWTLTHDLQLEPCGKAQVDILEGKVAELKNNLENYDSEIAINYRNTVTKLEKAEKENENLKTQILALNSKIEELDATRRDYADKLETKELDMQMRWWLQGASIAFCGALVGILCIYIPRPRRKKQINRF